jgi:hypothetical protein
MDKFSRTSLNIIQLQYLEGMILGAGNLVLTYMRVSDRQLKMVNGVRQYLNKLP